MQVSARGSAVWAGVVAAVFLLALYLIRELPDLALTAVGAPSQGVARYGGIVVHYHTAADPTRRAIELPGLDQASAKRAIDILANGGVELREVIESDALLQVPMDQHGRRDYLISGVEVELDQWSRGDDPRSERAHDSYLLADEVATLDAGIKTAIDRGWQRPACWSA